MTGSDEAVTFDENGQGTITLKHGESKTIEGLPIGVSYTVVETANEDFTTGKTGDTGTITTTVSTAAFTNTRVVGGLEVTKTVESDLAADAGVEFEFTVTLSDTTISKSYSGTKTDKEGAESEITVAFTEGVAIFKLKDGEKVDITGLPTDVNYTVVETANEDFTTEKTGDEGTITTTKSTAAFTNTRKTGELEVSKTVVSDLAADADVEFEFTVTLSDTTISKSYSATKTDKEGTESEITVAFAEGVATITLKGGEKVDITGLPTDVNYTVTETANEDFTTEKTGDTGTITTTKSTAAFTNTRKTGDLEVSKTVVSDLSEDAEAEFEFTVTLSDTTISKSYSATKTDKEGTESEITVAFTDGAATVTLKDGEKVSITGLPTDVNYTVVETANEDFTTTKTGDTGTITTTISTAAFTNTRKTGDLEVSKTVVSDLAEDADVEFEFTVTLSDTTISKSYSGTKTDKEGTESELAVVFTNGVATVILKGGEKVDITGLPTDVGYTVAETVNEDFTTEKTGDTGTITTTMSTAAFTNTRKTINVNVLKVDENGAALTGASFSLTQIDDNGHIVTGGISQSGPVDKDGKLTFNKLVAGKYQLLETDCPDGYIKLSDAPIFEIKIDEGTGNLVVVFTDSELVKYDSNTITFTVMNTPGQALPMTGGIGTNGFMLLGIALAATASVLVVLKTMIERRRKAARLNARRRNTRR